MMNLDPKDHGWLYEERPEQAEDAPGGPWEIGSTMDQDEFMVKSKSGFLGPFTWERAVAHCDVLNRLKGDENG